MAGGAVFVPLFGWLLNQTWNHTVINGVAFYSAKDFHFALMILPISVIVSIILALLTKETYCRESN